MQLFEALFSKRGIKIPPINKQAKMKPQYLDNVSVALGVLPQVGIMTVFLTPMQVVDGDAKMILGRKPFKLFAPTRTTFF